MDLLLKRRKLRLTCGIDITGSYEMRGNSLLALFNVYRLNCGDFTINNNDK